MVIKRRETSEYPYRECANCKTIDDCPHPDVEDNLMGTPMCPDSCPFPIDIMKETEKQRKLKQLHNVKPN